MEAFKDEETNGKIALILGGMDRGDKEHPKLSLIAFKAPYPSPVGEATTEGSAFMKGFFTESHTREFIAESHKLLGEQDTKKAGKSVRGFLAHTQYLMHWMGWRLRKETVVRWLTCLR